MIEIERKHLLGKRVDFKLTKEGAARLNTSDGSLQIRVVEIQSDQITGEIITLTGYDSDYTNFSIYGDEIEGITPLGSPILSSKEFADKYRERKEKK